jgi:MFS family permease
MASSEKDIPRDDGTLDEKDNHLQPGAGDGDEERPPSPTARGEYVNEKALVRKLDVRLLPVLTLLYLLSFLDRSNVGNARVEGLAKDLHMTGDQYLTGLTLYFIGYVLFEVPANIVLKLSSPRFWLPTLTLVWGVVSTLMGVTQSRAGFFVVRFFLGVAEAGLFPGIVFYFSMWYKRNERQFRVALFFSAASLAGAFGGILAWGIAHMKGVGGYDGWRWIFILEGLLTVVVSAASYFFVQNYPASANFLTDSERDLVQRRLKEDSDATEDEKFNWHNVRAAVTDVKCYLYALGFHTLSLPLYTLSLFLPSIITSLGYTAAQAQLMTIPPYAIAFILTLSVAFLSERYRRRAPLILASSSLAILGYILLLSDHRPGVSYLGTIFAAGGIYPSVALTLAWPANNVSGQTKRAIANALQISIGNLGAVLGTQLYRTETAPRYYLGHSFALGYMVANLAVTSGLWWVLKRENERRDAVAAASSSVDVDDAPWRGDEDPRWRFHL